MTTIVLTHAHSGHAGGAAGMARATDRGLTVHSDDAGFVRTGSSPPNDRSRFLGRLMDHRLHMDPPRLFRTMADGELPARSQLRVHHTPGHTPGHSPGHTPCHCSLLHEPSSTLITGDAIWNMRSQRTWPALAFCTDAALTQRTAATLAGLEYETAALTHGPEIRDGGREAIRDSIAHPRRLGPGL